MKSQEYLYYVKEGRKLLHAIETHQAVIGYYASCVCTIKHGGKTSDEFYTLTDYAADLGINRRTLSHWSIIYRTVIEKLGLDPLDVTQDDWSIAKRVSNILVNEKRAYQEQSGLQRRKGRGWPMSVTFPVEHVKRLFEENRKAPSVQSQFDTILDSTIYMKNKIRKMDLTQINQASLMSMRMNLEQALNEVTNHLINTGVSMAHFSGATI